MKIIDNFYYSQLVDINTFERTIKRGFIIITIIIEDRRTDLIAEEYPTKYKHCFCIQVFKKDISTFSFRSKYIYLDELTKFAMNLLFIDRIDTNNNDFTVFDQLSKR